MDNNIEDEEKGVDPVHHIELLYLFGRKLMKEGGIVSVIKGSGER